MHFGHHVFDSAVRVVIWKRSGAADSSFDHTPNAAHGTNDLSGITSTQSRQGVFDGPILAYVNSVSMNRKKLFNIAEDGVHYDTPVSRLKALQLKQMMPGKPDQDAYFMGMFLAMAQSHF